MPVRKPETRPATAASNDKDCDSLEINKYDELSDIDTEDYIPDENSVDENDGYSSGGSRSVLVPPNNKNQWMEMYQRLVALKNGIQEHTCSLRVWV